MKHLEHRPTNKKVKLRHQRATSVDVSDSEEDESHIPEAPVSPNDGERELFLTRKYMRRWWQAAGLPGHPALCEEEKSEVSGVPWAKGIAPKLEGRIRIINVAAWFLRCSSCWLAARRLRKHWMARWVAVHHIKCHWDMWLIEDAMSAHSGRSELDIIDAQAWRLRHSTTMTP